MNEQNQALGFRARLYFLAFGALWILLIWRLIGASGAHAPAVPNALLTVYYADKQALVLVPLSCQGDRFGGEPPAAWASALFDKLATAPDSDVLSAVTPHAKLLEALWNPPVWTLRLQVPQEQGTTEETLLVNAVARSFLENTPGATQVQVGLIDGNGKPDASQHLDLSQPLTPADLANRAPDAPPEGVAVTCWWRVPATLKLVPMETTLTSGSGNLARDAFQRWLEGPPATSRAFLAPAVPQGLSPQWQAPQGAIARVSLNREPPPTAEGQRFIEAATLTLTAQNGIHAVRFLHDGLPITGLIGPYDLAQPVSRPLAVNLPLHLPPATNGHQDP